MSATDPVDHALTGAAMLAARSLDGMTSHEQKVDFLRDLFMQCAKNAGEQFSTFVLEVVDDVRTRWGYDPTALEVLNEVIATYNRKMAER